MLYFIFEFLDSIAFIRLAIIKGLFNHNFWRRFKFRL